MKIQSEISVVVLAKVENEYQGNKYFNLTVFSDPERPDTHQNYI